MEDAKLKGVKLKAAKIKGPSTAHKEGELQPPSSVNESGKQQNNSGLNMVWTAGRVLQVNRIKSKPEDRGRVAPL